MKNIILTLAVLFMTTQSFAVSKDYKCKAIAGEGLKGTYFETFDLYTAKTSKLESMLGGKPWMKISVKDFSYQAEHIKDGEGVAKMNYRNGVGLVNTALRFFDYGSEFRALMLHEEYKVLKSKGGNHVEAYMNEAHIELIVNRADAFALSPNAKGLFPNSFTVKVNAKIINNYKNIPEELVNIEVEGKALCE